LFNLQKILMELGKGYAFVARQQHIHTEKQDYYIDLVFDNYILKCAVLVDLKTTKYKLYLPYTVSILTDMYKCITMYYKAEGR
jgi:predicted nuclease of restriction endonuclease-like (RecB) superfamily